MNSAGIHCALALLRIFSKKGFDTAAIMRAGGWKSVNTLSRYLEKAEHNVWA
jgi:hypothetical protein